MPRLITPRLALLAAFAATLLACGDELPFDLAPALSDATDLSTVTLNDVDVCLPGTPRIDAVQVTREGAPGTALFIEVSGETCDTDVESFEWNLYDADATLRLPRAPWTEVTHQAQADGRFTLSGYTRASCGDFRGAWLEVKVLAGRARSRSATVALPE